MKIRLKKICTLSEMAKQCSNMGEFGSASDIIKSATEDSVNDIGWMVSVLVVEGGNKNFAWFERSDLISSFPTALLKPINVSHIADKPIGVIYDSALVRINVADSPDMESYEIVPFDKVTVSEDGILDVPPECRPLGIIVAGAVWKRIFPDEWSTIENGYKDGSIKVSMECVAQNYQLRLGAMPDDKIVDITPETAHLKKCVGQLVDGKRIYRIPRDLTFVGMAQTPIPAEVRARILEVAKIEGKKPTQEVLTAALQNIVAEEVEQPQTSHHSEDESNSGRRVMKENDVSTESAPDETAKLLAEKLKAEEAARVEAENAKAAVQAELEQLRNEIEQQKLEAQYDKQLATRTDALTKAGAITSIEELPALVSAAIRGCTDEDFAAYLQVEVARIDAIKASVKATAVKEQAEKLGLPPTATEEEVETAHMALIEKASTDLAPPPPTGDMPETEKAENADEKLELESRKASAKVSFGSIKTAEAV